MFTIKEYQEDIVIDENNKKHLLQKQLLLVSSIDVMTDNCNISHENKYHNHNDSILDVWYGQ